MTHEDAGNYSAKHSANSHVDETLTRSVKEHSRDSKIACAVSFQLAKENKASPREIGLAIDSSEIKIEKCQLGLFGYHPDKKIVKPASSVSPEVKALINDLIVDNSLSCFNAWEIAKRLHVSKMEVAAACDTLNIKIRECQLGAF